MEPAVQINPAAPAKKKVSFIIMVVALALTFCIAIASLVSAVLLFLNDNSLRDQIADLKSESVAAQDTLKADDAKLQEKISGLSKDVIAIKDTEIADLKTKMDQFGNVELASVKTDVAALKEKTKDIHPDFNVGTLKLKFDNSYAYTDYYDGKASVTCSDKDAKYLVLIKVNLKSGGTPGKEDEFFVVISVINGLGELITFDSNSKGKLVKPVYSLEIVGFTKFDDWKK